MAPLTISSSSPSFVILTLLKNRYQKSVIAHRQADFIHLIGQKAHDNEVAPFSTPPPLRGDLPRSPSIQYQV
jgi:hypothetical protein